MEFSDSNYSLELKSTGVRRRENGDWEWNYQIWHKGREIWAGHFFGSGNKTPELKEIINRYMAEHSAGLRDFAKFSAQENYDWILK